MKAIFLYAILLLSAFLPMSAIAQTNEGLKQQIFFQPKYQVMFDAMSSEDQKSLGEALIEFQQNMISDYESLPKFGTSPEFMFPICLHLTEDQNSLMISYLNQKIALLSDIYERTFLSKQGQEFLLALLDGFSMSDELELELRIDAMYSGQSPDMFFVGNKTKVTFMAKKPFSDDYMIVKWAEIQSMEIQIDGENDIFLLSLLRPRILNQVFEPQFPLSDYTCWDKVENLYRLDVPKSKLQSRSFYIVPDDQNTFLYSALNLSVVISNERENKSPFQVIPIARLKGPPVFMLGFKNNTYSVPDFRIGGSKQSPTQWYSVVSIGGYHFVGDEHMQILIKNSEFEK